MRILLLSVALLSAPEWVSAQSHSRPDPAEPSAAAPRPAYRPTFSDYQPFRDEQVRSWKEVNKEVADNPGMGSMKHGSGTTVPGVDSKTGDAAKGKGGPIGHDMGSMQQKPGASKPGMDAKTGDTANGMGGAAGHDRGAMRHKPGNAMSGMDKPAATAPKNKDGQDMTAMAKPHSAPARPVSGIAGTGVVQSVDKSNAKVKLTHDPIAAMGWPKMTMFFRLKDRSLADQVKEGDKIDFMLEKSADGYVISGFRKSSSELKPTVGAPKPAGHGKH